jgi:nitrogen fixation/metabolism regulation signal transduction histidine kinase
MTPADPALAQLSGVALRQPNPLLRRVTALVAIAMVLIGLLLLYLLAKATNSGEMYEQNYTQLFTINLVVAGALGVLIAWAAWRMYQRVRQGRFGSRLLLKIATIFALVGVAPGLLIYVVSYQFVSRSIETWFDVKVEGALDAGLALGRVTLDTLSNDLAAKARVAAEQLAENQQIVPESTLVRLMEQVGASDASVWSASGKLISSAGSIGIQLSPDKPSSTQLRAAKAERSYAWIDGLEDAAMGKAVKPSIKALVPIPNASLGLSSEQRFLLVQRVLPANFVANALAVDNANREYQERALGRSGLKRMYIGTLTLSLFLAVFGAILLAIVLGNQIARPLLVLTEGVSQVAAGDLTPKLALQSKDELGGLTRAFASMTQQLADARQTVQTSIVQLDSARGRLQTILDNLTSGVLVLNAAGKVLSVNPGAARILQLDAAQLLGSQMSDLPGLEALGQGIAQQFDDFLQTPGDARNDHWQQSFELGESVASLGSASDRSVTLVARGAILPDASRLVVFDDISEIVSAQRARAWGEVARRLAHEIKNPLTPIQLSAERLERRLTGKLEASEQQVLAKSVKTIVEQVDAMKRLVNDFRDYARLPAAQLEAVDLNELVDGILHLYESSPIPIRLELEAGIPPVLGDPQQLRQVLHNLLQNGLDATSLHLEEATPGPDASTLEVTELVVRTQYMASSGRVRLIIQDQGGGFPEHILKRAFEPYVTTKRSGTGLGLAVVKKIADDHGGRIEISNRMNGALVLGAQVSLSLACVANVKHLENTISDAA